MMYMHAYIGFLLSHLNDENHGFTISKRINKQGDAERTQHYDSI